MVCGRIIIKNYSEIVSYFFVYYTKNVVIFLKTTTFIIEPKVVNIKKDGNGREIAIIDRTERANKDFVVAIGYHTETGDWKQGRYGFDTLQKAEQWREAEYGSGKQNQNEIRYLKVRVATDALIKQYPTSSLFKMPTGGEYAG